MNMMKEWKTEDSVIVAEHLPCADCGSHDALSQYSDGHTYCFSCHAYHSNHDANDEKKESKQMDKTLIQDWEYLDIPTRKLTAETCRKYGYGIAHLNDKPVQVANYYNSNHNIVFQKIRDKDKNFRIKGSYVPMFFGQHLFQGGRKLVVTEGEIDCLTVSQVQGNKYPVVSIPSGAQSAGEVFKQNLDWLNHFEEVIAMFDMDRAGRQGLEHVYGLLPPHKLKIASLTMKDPNELLKAGKPDEIIRAIWQAQEYRPDGIINAKDYEDILLAPEADIVSYDFPWASELTKKTRGIRKGEMLLLTAGSGIGKSTTAREIAYHLKMHYGLKIGMVMLEESPKKTIRDLLSIHLSKPLHLMWNDSTKEDIKKHYDEVFGDGNFVLYDHFGSIESSSLLEKIRYLIVSEGCDFVIFDHISIAVTALDDNGANERQVIDRLMTQLRSLVEETGAGIVLVSHLRKTDTKTKPFENGGLISLDDLRGSGSLKQLPDTIIALERNQQADDDSKNILKLRVLKCRFTGDTGLADYVRFNRSTNRIEDTDDLEIPRGEEDTKCQF